MNGHYLASCYSKQRFETFEVAKEAAFKLGLGATPYKCQHCEYYHRGRK